MAGGLVQASAWARLPGHLKLSGRLPHGKGTTVAKMDEEKAKQVISGWKSLRPKKKFAGMTVEEFEAVLTAVHDAEEKVVALETQLGTARDARDKAWGNVSQKCQMVISAVKGDPEEGLDGDLVQAMGYKKASDKKPGGRRKSAPLAEVNKLAA